MTVTTKDQAGFIISVREITWDCAADVEMFHTLYFVNTRIQLKWANDEIEYVFLKLELYASVSLQILLSITIRVFV